MDSHPEIYADFHNADIQGRLRLNCVGTVNDLSRQQVEPREGLLFRSIATMPTKAGTRRGSLRKALPPFRERSNAGLR
jgi:hypothetical protein